MTTTPEILDRLEADYLERKAKILADNSLSWEQKEKAIKVLGEEHHAQRRLAKELHKARRQGRMVFSMNVENTTTSGSAELNREETT